MTTTQITGVSWRRGVEDRYPFTMDASLDWGPYDIDVDGEFLSGMVVGIRTGTGNQIVKADNAANAGRFKGILFTEVSRNLDESAGGAPPTVIVGPALLFVRKSALVAAEPYAAGDYLQAGTGANVGRLVRATVGAAGSNAENIVGRIQEVQADGILFRLYPATA